MRKSSSTVCAQSWVNKSPQRCGRGGADGLCPVAVGELAGIKDQQEKLRRPRRDSPPAKPRGLRPALITDLDGMDIPGGIRGVAQK